MEAKDTDIIAIINIIRSKGDQSAEDLLQLKRYGVKHGFGFENVAVPEHVNKKDLRFKAYGLILSASSSHHSAPSRSSKVRAVLEEFERNEAAGSHN